MAATATDHIEFVVGGHDYHRQAVNLTRFDATVDYLLDRDAF
jgi:hypothetical protein